MTKLTWNGIGVFSAANVCMASQDSQLENDKTFVNINSILRIF